MQIPLKKMTLYQRVRRELDANNRIMHKPHAQDVVYVIENDSIIGVYPGLEELARSIGVMRPYESLGT